MYTVQEVGEYLQRNMKNSKLFGVAPSSQITTVAEYTFLKQPVVGQLWAMCAWCCVKNLSNDMLPGG